MRKPKKSAVKARSGRKYFNLPDGPMELPFSDAVQVGNTLYLAGRIGIDPKTGCAATDVEQELRLLLDGIKRVLEAAKMTMDDLVYVTVYCTDLSLFSTFNAIYRTYFQGEFPARAFLGAGSLVLGARFEIQAMALRRTSAAKAASQ